MSNSEHPINYLTVRQISEKYPAFSQGGIRSLIFNAHHNGFSQCIRRIGRKILIKESIFIEWVEGKAA
jgi:hypothetical protein